MEPLSEGMGRESITVLLPALDEEATIGPVIDDIPVEFLQDRGFDVDVVVVDGHSVDRTTEVARQKGARIVTQRGFGKGDALKAAFGEFDGGYLFMLDADQTYPARDIRKMLPPLESGDYDVVMGSRLNGHMAPEAMNGANYFGNKVLTFTANVLFPRSTPSTDVCTGMWGFDGRVVRDLTLTSMGFEVEAEIYTACVKAGYRIREVPIKYRRRVGRPKLKAVRDGLRIWSKILHEKIVD